MRSWIASALAKPTIVPRVIITVAGSWTYVDCDEVHSGITLRPLETAHA